MTPKEQKRPIILVVDDVPENIDVLKGALDSNYTIRPAPNGQIALKAANVPPYPDLVLLDIMMPGIDGYEVCRRLKANENTRDIPIIFVTAKTDENDELVGLDLGAVDYITKPISIPILKARVKTHLALQAAKQKLDEHNQHLQHERDIIEQIILKMRDEDAFEERNLRYIISPVEETAGDMLLSTFTPDGRQLILLGDFTGHGLTAAIGGPLVTYILYELAKQKISGEEIFREINSQMCAKLPIGLFFAAIFIEILPEREKANLWNSALPEALLIRDGKVENRFSSNLVPLGISDKIDVAGSVSSISLQKGDHLYAFTDGIVESKTLNGDMFGDTRLEEFLKKVSLEEQTLGDLMILLENHTGSSVYEDDITLVEVLF